MDSPICVFDAQTFVNNIHQIKAWFYDGHLRLVVPLSTSENVEQLYKRSVEPKPTVQEQTRPKSAGKSARKVHPAFDINPTIAREFLARIQKGKEEEQYVKERPFYEEHERWNAMQFQASKEEYTPWKDILVEKEEVEVSDDRPLSWAELAKKKLLANGSADKSQSPQGPAKPKLVTKASGSDMQPWKMQKNAPTVSAKDVPGNLRSLMSCALWRLHESIDRNDSNQLFLLSDQEHIRAVAKTLNVTVRSTKELGKKITASSRRDDLNVLGMLEKENLVKPKEDAKIVVPGDETRKENTEERVLTPRPDGGLFPHLDSLGQEGRSDGVNNVERPEDGMRQKQTDENGLRSARASDVTQDKDSPRVSSDHPAQTAFDPRDLVKSILKPSLGQAQIQQATEIKAVQDDMNSPNKLQPAAELAEASPDQTKKKIPIPAIQNVVPNASAAKSASSAAQESQEDSDEEVVVFVPNPKRMSAQKKSLTSSSRPSTTHGESPASPMRHSPRTSLLNAQSMSQAAEHDSPQVQGISHGHPRPLSSGPVVNDPDRGSLETNAVLKGQPGPPSLGPTLIDPDAFGRAFPVNAGPGTFAKVGSSKRSHQHSPRNSMQYASPNSSGTFIQNSPRTSPSRHKAGRSPRPSPRVLPQKVEDSPPTSIPVISHQAYTRAPLIAPNPQSTQKSRFGAIGPPSKSATTLRHSEPSRDMESIRDSNFRQPPIQRPRSAHGPGFGNGSSLLQPQVPRPNPLNASMASGRGGNREQRSSRPSLFEPELDRTAASTDADFESRRINIPEVQYTLKSGTTREAARGKGKLWVG